jgi:glyoxylase-like metal-dependent hydrolase (beta-lactamase superfamily II)
MVVRQLFDAETSTFTYLLVDPASRNAALIDSVREQVDRDLHLVDELGVVLTHVLDTHTHADHITGAGLIRARTRAHTYGSTLGASCTDVHLRHGDLIEIGASTLSVLATPGHTDDSISYYTPGAVFTGDALLIRGCGRTDFQNGDARTLFDSITRVLWSLPDDTIVYPAHDYRGFTSSTIGEERRWNPRVAGSSPDAFAALMDNLHLPRPRKMDEAVPANRACGLSVQG